MRTRAIAVEMKALISAVWAVAVAASMTMTIATIRMTIPATKPTPHRTLSHSRASVGRFGASLQPAAVGRQSPLTVDLQHATSPAALKRAKACRDVRAWRVE